MLSASFEVKNIDFKVVADQKIRVFSDHFMLDTILRNLISNAIKYTPKNGEIQFIAKKHDSYTELIIKDSGVGIKKEVMDKLFDKEQFYSSKGTDKEKGTGLGLLICKEFIERHQGEIWAESEPGKGSKFHVTMPEPFNV